MWTTALPAAAGGRHCPFKSQFRAPIFMQPRARRVSQGNQRIRGQWRSSPSLSLFMQYFGHGTDEQTAAADDDDEVGDLIIWFPLHGRPDRAGLPGRGTMGADGRTEGTSFCQCTYATQLERRETPGEGFNFAITTDKIHFNCATTTFRIIASISHKRPQVDMKTRFKNGRGGRRPSFGPI